MIFVHDICSWGTHVISSCDICSYDIPAHDILFVIFQHFINLLKKMVYKPYMYDIIKIMWTKATPGWKSLLNFKHKILFNDKLAQSLK